MSFNRLRAILAEGGLRSTGHSREWPLGEEDGLMLVSRVKIVHVGEDLFTRRRCSQRSLHECCTEHLDDGTRRITEVTLRLTVYDDGMCKLNIHFYQRVMEGVTCLRQSSWQETHHPAEDIEQVCMLAG